MERGNAAELIFGSRSHAKDQDESELLGLLSLARVFFESLGLFSDAVGFTQNRRCVYKPMDGRVEYETQKIVPCSLNSPNLDAE